LTLDENGLPELASFFIIDDLRAYLELENIKFKTKESNKIK
jgi:hypothetical protein